MKSTERRFAEAMDAIRKAGRVKQFDEAVKNCTTIESKLCAAEAVLKGVGIIPVKESKPRLHNGATDNFVENNPLGRTVEEFRESANSFSPGFIKETISPYTGGDKALADGLLRLGKITEAEHRQLTGAKPAGYDQLNDKGKREFDFARAIGISEAGALQLAKGNSIFKDGDALKEVSR